MFQIKSELHVQCRLEKVVVTNQTYFSCGSFPKKLLDSLWIPCHTQRVMT